MPPSGNARQVNPRACDWFAGPRAVRLANVEQRELIPCLTGVHGRHALYLRPGKDSNTELSGHLLGEVIRLYADPETDGWRGDIDAAATRFPIADESLSLVYLLHSLNHCESPRQLLQEAARTLAPEGSLIVVGLNPISPWSWRWRGRGPHAPSTSRVRRWIEQAGMTPVKLHALGPCSPMSEAELPRRGDPVPSPLRWLCAGFAWSARKRPAGLTPDAQALRDRSRQLRANPKAAINAG